MRIKSFIPIFLALACSSKSDLQKLYIRQITVFQKPSGAFGSKDSLFTFNEEYIDISLKSYGNGKHFQAEKNLTQNQEGSIKWMLIDSLKNEMQFSGTTEFLNYMSKRGYEPTNQTNNKYGTDYTFNKK